MNHVRFPRAEIEILFQELAEARQRLHQARARWYRAGSMVHMTNPNTHREYVFVASRCQQKINSIEHKIATIIFEAADPRLAYDPEFGDERVCRCLHPYRRHFDSYDHMLNVMLNVGCKYCGCEAFVETSCETCRLHKEGVLHEEGCLADRNATDET